jgi:hypothetical protein
MEQFLPYAVGNKIYGAGRPYPNIGPSDKLGYRERDRRAAARRAALLRRLMAMQNSDYMSPDVGRKI